MDPNQEFERLQMQREQQEQNLNYIINQTGEIKQITIMIGDELQTQNQILSDMSTHMDTIQDKLKKNIHNIEQLTRSKNSPLLLISVILTLILIFLIYWLI